MKIVNCFPKLVYLIVFGVFCPMPKTALAQVPNEQLLDEIKIYADKNSLFGNRYKTTIDSTMLQKMGRSATLGKILQYNGSSKIKSYGAAGSLTTISLRGSGAENTSISFNGFPLNSIANGGMDLSVLPAVFFHSVSIIPGAESSLYGSGTFGGAVELNTFRSTNSELFSLTAGSEFGSYKNQSFFSGINFSNQTVSVQISALKSHAVNNFPFTDKYKFGQPSEIRTHNASSTICLLNSLEYKFSKREKIQSSLILFNKNKEIPEIAGSYGESNQLQKDSGIYFTLRYNKLSSKGKLSAGSAIFTNAQHYQNILSESDSIGIRSDLFTKQLLNDMSYRYYWTKKLTVETGISLNFLNAESTNYADIPHEFNYNLFFGGNYNLGTLVLKTSFAPEFSRNYAPQPIFSGGLSYSPDNSNFTVNGSVSNKFRRPTFNEQFWVPGGNQNIRPESAMALDLSIQLKLIKTSRLKLTFNSDAYYTAVKDMIRWLPVNGVWQAVNNRRAYNRGSENSLKFNVNNSELRVISALSYYYTRSTQSKPSFEKGEFRNQLMYIPKHSVKLRSDFSCKNVESGLWINYYSKQYTTDSPSINDQLPAYTLVNWHISYTGKIQKVTGEVSFRIENIFNTSYESIKSYPMPGRLFFIGLNFKYTK